MCQLLWIRWLCSVPLRLWRRLDEERLAWSPSVSTSRQPGLAFEFILNFKSSFVNFRSALHNWWRPTFIGSSRFVNCQFARILQPSSRKFCLNTPHKSASLRRKYTAIFPASTKLSYRFSSKKINNNLKRKHYIFKLHEVLFSVAQKTKEVVLKTLTKQIFWSDSYRSLHSFQTGAYNRYWHNKTPKGYLRFSIILFRMNGNDGCGTSFHEIE